MRIKTEWRWENIQNVDETWKEVIWKAEEVDGTGSKSCAMKK
jgi:hypothetical protein